MHLSHTRKSGFTLIELLVVISIIGLLSSVVFSSVNSARLKAQEVVMFNTIKEVDKVIKAYQAEFGTFPLSESTTCGGLSCRICATASETRWPPASLSNYSIKAPTQIPYLILTNFQPGCMSYQSDENDYELGFVIRFDNTQESLTNINKRLHPSYPGNTNFDPTYEEAPCEWYDDFVAVCYLQVVEY